jgi:hypothetical protein
MELFVVPKSIPIKSLLLFASGISSIISQRLPEGSAAGDAAPLSTPST